MRLVASVCPSVLPSVSTLMAEPFDLWLWYLVWGSTLTLARLGLKVEVEGQGQMPKIVLWHHYYLALRSRSKFGVKFKGQDKISGAQWLILGPRLCPVPSKKQRRATTNLRCLCVFNQWSHQDSRRCGWSASNFKLQCWSKVLHVNFMNFLWPPGEGACLEHGRAWTE